MKFKTVVPILMMSLVPTIVACAGKEKSSDNLSDAETEEMYGDSPAPEWGFEVITREDKAAEGEESYLHAGGFKYEGLAIKMPGGYAEYSNHDDYQSLVTLFYLADHLAYKYSKSGDVYPTKKEWTDFQNEVLGPLCEGAWNWEAIPVKKWKKEAGDYYYTLDNLSIMIGDRGAEWQTYFYDTYFGNTEWKKQLIIRAAKEDNEFQLPEGAVFIRTIVF